MSLFVYWTACCCAQSLIVYINASLIERRELSAAHGKKCQRSTGLNEVEPSQHTSSGDDGVSSRHQGVNECRQLPAVVRASSTVVRKQFHVVAMAMFVPGLLMDVSLLRVAASCALVMLVMFEVSHKYTVFQKKTSTHIICNKHDGNSC